MLRRTLRRERDQHARAEFPRIFAGNWAKRGCGKCADRVFELSPKACCLRWLFLGFKGRAENTCFRALTAGAARLLPMSHSPTPRSRKGKSLL